MIQIIDFWIPFILFNLNPKVNEAQNLVPNSSFEEVNFDYCGLVPSTETFEDATKYWLAPTDARPSIDSKALDPSCWNYLRIDAKSGKRVAVILAFAEGNFRSYLQVPLNGGLSKGKIYCTEIFVRIRKESQSGCNNIGLYFSDTLVKEKTRHNLNFEPQVNHTDILSDTSSWISLKGKFKATSNAKYLLIGNFYDNENTKTERIRRNIGVDPEVIFYFVDDISVKEDKDSGNNED